MTPSDSPAHGQRRERRPGAHEDDPTGIRDLLAALPDPGPMPEDLVERIGARIAVEQAHREQSSAGGLAARSDSVIDLAAERSHRRPGRTVALMGAAAAGLLVATMAIGQFAGVGPAGSPAFDSAAQVPARGGAAEAGAGADSEDAAEDAGGDAGSRTDTAGAGDVGALGGSLAADVVVLPELGVVDATDYHERIVERAVEEAAPQGGAAEGALTEAGARTCWQAAAQKDRWPTLRAAEAEMGGDRVVVLLGMRDAVSGQALVLPWACTQGEDVSPLEAVTLAP